MKPMTTDDGLTLHLRTWPAANSSRGVAVLVHGLGEHIDRYDHVARRHWGRHEPRVCCAVPLNPSDDDR